MFQIACILSIFLAIMSCISIFKLSLGNKPKVEILITFLLVIASVTLNIACLTYFG